MFIGLQGTLNTTGGDQQSPVPLRYEQRTTIVNFLQDMPIIYHGSDIIFMRLNNQVFYIKFKGCSKKPIPYTTNEVKILRLTGERRPSSQTAETGESL